VITEHFWRAGEKYRPADVVSFNGASVRRALLDAGRFRYGLACLAVPAATGKRPSSKRANRINMHGRISICANC